MPAAVNKRILAALLAAACFAGAFPFYRVEAQAPRSAGEIVLEVNSGRVLYESDADRVLPMASTTKILTALIVIEDRPLDVPVTVPAHCTGVEGSSIYLVAGEKLTVRDLLYGLMLRSGNDCAETLACFHSGSVEKFADCMNRRARALGARNSHFVNPHGLPDKGHYTTARDLGCIACAAMRNAVFREIVSARSAVIPDGGCGYVRRLVNKNKMLTAYDGANGVKTGYTKEAGRCLVSSAERDGMQLVSVVLDSPDMYGRSRALLDDAFAAFSYRKIFDAAEHRYPVLTDVPQKPCVGACLHDVWYPLREEEEALVYTEAELPPRRMLPVQEGEELGILRIYLKNRLLFSQKIVSIECVKKNWADILGQIARDFVRREDTCASINFLRSAAWRAAAPQTG